MESEARHWDDVTTTDAPAIIRNRAEARRDAIDWAVQQLRTALPAIEEEAVAEDRGTAEWLDAGAGIGDGPECRMRDFEEAVGAECGCRPEGLAA
jgi:hypothetical protein